MATILFVDEDLSRLATWSRALSVAQPDWSVHCASSREDALRRLRETHYDAAAVNARTPGADGSLLDEIRNRHPDLLRIALCADGDQVTRRMAWGAAHSVLSTTGEPHQLVAVVTQASSIRARMQHEALRRVVAGIQTFPSLPSLYRELVQEVRSPEASMKRIAQLIAKDPAMSAKMLQIANSAYFGFAEPIVNPAHAVLLLGLDTVTSLVLLWGVFSQFQGGSHTLFTPEILWEHSLATAVLARAIAWEEEAAPVACDQAFTAGLLHDVGTLVLATHLPELYRDALAVAEHQGMCEWEAEREVFGTTHADIGAYLLGLWGIDHAIVQAVAFHHDPDQAAATGCTALLAAHVADALDYQAHAGVGAHPPGLLKEDYLRQQGYGDRLPIWLALSRARIRGA
jgi:HD-like signal output (HDOD) protein